MKKHALLTCLSFAASLLPCGQAHAQGAAPVTLRSDLGQPGARVSPMLYGLMTEEIDHAYDGGLYAELLQMHTKGSI